MRISCFRSFIIYEFILNWAKMKTDSEWQLWKNVTSLRFKLNSFNKILLLVLVKFEFTKTSKSFQNMHFRLKFKTLLKRWKIKLIFFCTLIFFMESNIAIFSQNCLMFYSAVVADIKLQWSGCFIIDICGYTSNIHTVLLLSWSFYQQFMRILTKRNCCLYL